jgi:hypothetical protein
VHILKREQQQEHERRNDDDPAPPFNPTPTLLKPHPFCTKQPARFGLPQLKKLHLSWAKDPVPENLS